MGEATRTTDAVPPTAHESPCIVIVDDEEPILHSLQRLLSFENYTIVLCTSAEPALEAIAAHNCAVIISDQHMPGMQGVDLLRAVRERSPHTSRILFSGHIDVELLRNAVNGGEVYRFITKPWNDEELLMAVSLGAERSQLLLENEQLHQKSVEQNKELQKFNSNLEQMVRTRTAALELRNSALMMNQDVLDRLPVIVIGIDPEHNLVLANALARSMFDDLVIGIPIHDSLPPALCDWITHAHAEEHKNFLLEFGNCHMEIISLDLRGKIIVGHSQGVIHETFE